jgi:hypothetical protein
VPYVAGKAGSSLGSFVKLIEGMRFETQQLPLPEMVQVMLEKSTLILHYQGEKKALTESKTWSSSSLQPLYLFLKKALVWMRQHCSDHRHKLHKIL